MEDRQPILEIIDFFQDCIFPIFCLGCDKEGEWLCAECLNRINTSGVADHSDPIEHPALARVFAVTVYDEAGLIGQLIHTVKYAYAWKAAAMFIPLIERWLAVYHDALSSIDVIVPVPLHRRRFAERGFNQAELIAQIIASRIGYPVTAGLDRHRYTDHQARLSKKARQVNVTGAFLAKNSQTIRDKHVLLVDDVYTTGSTMRECATILSAAGAASVSGFALARG